MRYFDIRPVDPCLSENIQQKIDHLNKPKGSLGRLESLAKQICLVQQTLSPSLSHPCHLLMGGDHGIEREGVSVSPREVTWQQMVNFTHGGGGVNMFCRQHRFHLRIIDMGVDHDLSGVEGIENHKVAYGTANFLHGPAMTEEQYWEAINTGASLVDECAEEGCNILCVGEMGIANTSPSSIWMSLFGNIPLDECVGAGAGLNDEGIRHKCRILQKSMERYREWSQQNGHAGLTVSTPTSPTSPNCLPRLAIRYFGGFEMVGAIGAMLRAAERRMLVMVDGFIMTACMLAASRLYPSILDYAIFGHCGDESGHQRMLGIMHAEPLLHLGLRLGEGTGALCAYPIIESAVRMINEMNNFDNANITKYF